MDVVLFWTSLTSLFIIPSVFNLNSWTFQSLVVIVRVTIIVIVRVLWLLTLVCSCWFQILFKWQYSLWTRFSVAHCFTEKLKCLGPPNITTNCYPCFRVFCDHLVPKTDSLLISNWYFYSKIKLGITQIHSFTAGKIRYRSRTFGNRPFVY